jgi:hypothetical protein
MRAWLRLLIILCTALALPVQGFAAAAMVHCGPSHARMHAGVQAHDATAAHEHRHEHRHESTHAHASSPAADEVQQASLADLSPYKCGSCGGSCASCCTGLALITHLPRVPEAAPTATAFVVETVHIPTRAQPGPDRPPRMPLA